ncbi:MULTISPECIES: hypothetical protein [Achromobacter]|uniref:hypothetical protein n=1 Tax=Achromobacter TaxID=222 RepID=UPI00257EDFEB|nr:MULTISPECIES: hypothetical protein [Achromobacter]
MSKDKRLDMDAARKLDLTLATGKVECQVSNRWLQFPSEAPLFSDGAYVFVNVMTESEGGTERKLCELILRKHELEHVLSRVQVRPRGD